MKAVPPLPFCATVHSHFKLTLGFKSPILFSMLPTLSDSSCSGCLARDATIVELQRQMQQMQQQIDALQDRMARAEKNSSNSSNPPSSDIVKPPEHSSRLGFYYGEAHEKPSRHAPPPNPLWPLGDDLLFSRTAKGELQS